MRYLLAFLLTCASTAPLVAQNSVQISGTLDLASGLSIAVDEANVSFGSADPTSDVVASGAPDVRISVVANVPFNISIAADEPEMTDGASGSKSGADVEWSLDGASWTPLSTTPAFLVTSATAGSHSGAWTLRHRVMIDPDDVPATYSIHWTLSVLSND
jgi:hypothetical protein